MGDSCTLQGHRGAAHTARPPQRDVVGLVSTGAGSAWVVPSAKRGVSAGVRGADYTARSFIKGQNPIIRRIIGT
eukprot:808612-Prorocentrum_minimum.AAC.1